MSSIINKCKYKKSIFWENTRILMSHTGVSSFDDVYGNFKTDFGPNEVFDTSSWLVNKFTISIRSNFKSLSFKTYGSHYDYLAGIKSYPEYDIFIYFLGEFFWMGYLGSLSDEKFIEEAFIIDESKLLSYKYKCHKTYKSFYRVFGNEFINLYQKFYNKIHLHEN